MKCQMQWGIYIAQIQRKISLMVTLGFPFEGPTRAHANISHSYANSHLPTLTFLHLGKWKRKGENCECDQKFKAANGTEDSWAGSG